MQRPTTLGYTAQPRRVKSTPGWPLRCPGFSSGTLILLSTHLGCRRLVSTTMSSGTESIGSCGRSSETLRQSTLTSVREGCADGIVHQGESQHPGETVSKFRARHEAARLPQGNSCEDLRRLRQSRVRCNLWRSDERIVSGVRTSQSQRWMRPAPQGLDMRCRHLQNPVKSISESIYRAMTGEKISY